MVVVTGRGSGGKVKTNRTAVLKTTSTTKPKGKSNEKSKSVISTSTNNNGGNKKTQQQEKLPVPANKKDKSISSKTANKLVKNKTTGKQSISASTTTIPPVSQLKKANKSIIETMVTSTNGPRIHAQRKFAQAGNVYSGTLQINTTSPSSTPSKSKESTPLKRLHEGGGGSSKKVKKPPFSPPASKRPRTDDFLTFLCFRGTPSLPPELDFFNYPQINELDSKLVQSKKKIFSHNQISTGVDVNKEPSQNADGSRFSGSQAQGHSAVGNKMEHSEVNGKVKKEDCGTSKTGQLTPNKQSTEKSKKKDDIGPTKKPIFSSTSTSSSCLTSSKAENPTKGIRATASSVLLNKMKKSSVTLPVNKTLPIQKTLPVLSPTKSLNEQDARFAMTALKLKYQRMASSKPNHSLLLTKKVKEKSIILTRSKARSIIPAAKISSRKGKIPPRSIKSAVISPARNAPSPDIIFGVSSSSTPNTKRKVVAPISESESKEDSTDTSDEESKSSKSSESESEDKEVKEKQFSQHVRSLRSGKEIIRAKSPLKEKKRVEHKSSVSLDLRRVGTRSAQRITKSPLRELPMYNANKNKTIKKKNLKNVKQKLALKKKEEEAKNEKSPSSKKSTKDLPSGARPSRKTKETAAFYMGLLSKGFSTDEEDSEGKMEEGEEDSELGSSSSSETKFLEKHYNASIKRGQQKKEKVTVKGKPEVQTRSTKETRLTTLKNQKSSDKEIKKSDAIKKTDITKTQENRKLRSQKSNEQVNKTNDAELSKGKQKRRSIESRRSSQSTPTVGDKKMAGAARKTASVVSRRRSRYSSSSGDDQSSSSEQSSTSDNESAQEDESDEEEEHQNYDDDVVVKSNSAVNSKKPTATTVLLSNDSSLTTTKVNKITKGKIAVKGETSKPTVKRSGGISSVRDDSKTIASEMRRLVEQKCASDSSSVSSTKSVVSTRREESVETEQCKASVDGSRSQSIRSSGSSSSSSSSSSSDNNESSSSSSSSEESDADDEVDPPVKVDMATQVDMDLEDGIIPISIPEQEELQQQQQQQQQQHEDSDDDVQEIGQVFASSSTSTTHQFTSHHHHMEEHSMISGSSRNSETIGYAMHHHEHLHHQQQEQQQHMGSLHSQFHNPFATARSLSQEFYTPLQLTPSPLVHSSIQLVGSNLGAAFPVTNPLNTLSIPVSVPHLSSLSSHLLSHAPAIGFTTGSTFHSATTLQTHIRSVATNLDIPLVRPVVGSDPSLNFMTRGPSIGLSLNGNSMNRHPTMGMWNHPPPPVPPPHHHTAHQMDPSRNHYSAFRTPHTTCSTPQQVIHHQSTTVLGMNSNPVLPVSIIQPQTQSQQHHHHHIPQQKTESSVRQSSYNQYQQQQGVSSTVLPSSSNTDTSHKTPPGYNIIKNLPNVSIVPKFDRNSKPKTELPSQEPSFSSTAGKKQVKGTNNKSVIDSSSKTTPEPKKVGRKKKQTMILPQPSSPLTVRKDSNPATYVGVSAKKNLKKNSSKPDLPTEESNRSDNKGDSTQENGDKFMKLLKMKKNNKDDKSQGESPGPSGFKSDKNAKGKSLENNLKPVKIKTTISSSPSASIDKFKQDVVVGADGIREAPTFHPTDTEFEDPLKYIQKIQSVAEKYGIARIVPPRSFRPECNVEDDMRFTAYNHYIHKMYQRWGPNVLESQMIKENLKNSQVDVSDVSMIGGMEINLSSLYQTVKSFGGLKEVIEKERWTKVADSMHVPKAAHDRATKLDAIYVKYVLPYEILSDGEREKLKKKLERRWAKRKDKILKAAENSEDDNSDEDSMDELDECIVKGKTTPLSTYFRVARNTLNIFFPTEKEHTIAEIEEEYWNIVKDRNRHVCVYSGSIDCAGVGWGFPIPKASNKHPWNLKVLANHQGSVLRSMGPVMGATVPTLHVSMLFTTYCWYRDPHSLPWVEYLHSGANKVWYSVAVAHEDLLRKALTELMPMQCKKKQIWLASDSAMVPPDVLISKGVPVVRAIQNPGEFLVVFPKAYTSAICTGYLISESVCFAYPSWLQSCLQTFKDIRNSKEPPVFPLEQLLLSILQDARASLDVVRMALPATQEIIKEEIALRKKISSLGIKHGGKISSESELSSGSKNSSKKKGASREEEIEQCYYCNYLLFLSMIRNKKTDSAMCLKHAVEHFSRHKADIKKSTILYDLDESQLVEIVDNASQRCGNRKPSEL